MTERPTLSPGKYRHLTQCSTPGGHFCVLAIDHRDNLLAELNRHASAPLNDADFVGFKIQVIRALAPAASAVLTDPAYGLGPGIVEGAIGGDVGLLSPLEITDYSLHPSRRSLRLIPGWSVRKVKRVGAQGVKLLVYYNPRADSARRARDTVARIVEECHRYDLPLFLEPIAYSTDEHRPLTPDALLAGMVDAAETFTHMGVDVLKLQFPVDASQAPDEYRWRAALAAVDAACGVPWVLLSGGVEFATFRRQVELACEAGASGVIVGRAVWAEATRLHGAARAEFLSGTASERMGELSAICARSGRDWRSRVERPSLALHWHEDFGEDMQGM